MTTPSTATIRNAAYGLQAAGISVIPIRLDRPKQPCMSWKDYEHRLPTTDELNKWFRLREWALDDGSKISSPPGIAAVAGKVSGGLECLDFDEGGLFEQWADQVDLRDSKLIKRLVIVRTPNNGVHCWYRCDQVEGNHVLASRPSTPEELAERPKKKIQVRIETRGEGGYALVPGSPAQCHELHREYQYDPMGCGGLASVQSIAPEDRKLLHEMAAAYNHIPVAPPKPSAPPTITDLKPGNDFDVRGHSWQQILEPAGWTLAAGDWENDGRLTRPGKTVREGFSATIGHCRGPNGEPLFNVFTSSDSEFLIGTYGKFRAYAIIYHRGDLSAAAGDLARQGFGAKSQTPTNTHKDTQNVHTTPTADQKPWEVKPTQAAPANGITLEELMKLELPPPRFAVDGLLCEGLTILGGKPKLGKSWLSLLIAWAVAAGEQIDGRAVSGGDVLFLALEDTPRRLQSRVRMLSTAVQWKFPERLTIHTNWGRADAGGLYYLAEWLNLHRGSARLVVIDTLAKFRRGKKSNANSYDEDYEDVGQLKKLCDEYSVSALIVHHTRKLKSEDPFDDLSGTLGIGGAADGILILDRDRGNDGGSLYVTGRDVPECTIPVTLDKVSFRWSLGTPVEGIDTAGRAATSPAATKVDQCCRWILSFLAEYAHPAAELDAAAKLAGYSGSAVRDAKAKLGKEGSGAICFDKRGQSEWWVGLTPKADWKPRPVVKIGSRPESSESSESSKPSGQFRANSPKSPVNSPTRRSSQSDDDEPDIWPE
jgi:hypothetical protein